MATPPPDWLTLLPQAALVLEIGAPASPGEMRRIKIVDANAAAGDLMRCDPASLAGQAFQELFAQEAEWARFILQFMLWWHLGQGRQWPQFQKSLRVANRDLRCQDPDACGFDFQWHTQASTSVWVNLALSPAGVAAAHPDQLVCVAHDITALKIRECRLRDHLENFRISQELAHLGSWDMTLDGHEMWCSQELSRILGLPQRESAITLAEFLDCTHPEDRDGLEAALRQAMREDGRFRMEYRVVRPGGEVRSVCGQSTFEHDELGAPIGLHGTLQDVTERRRAEDNLAIANKVFENAIEGVMVTNPAGVIQSVNRAFSEITGYPAEEALGKRPNFLRSDRHDAAFYAAMWQTLTHAGQWQGEIWNRRKNGEAYLEHLVITAALDHRNQPRSYIGVFHDLTHTRRNEENLAFRESHDALTGLMNRGLLTNLVEQSLSYAQHDHTQVAVLMLGIDRFKQINDTLGHAGGDSLLFNVAWRLSASVREGDLVARFGGDVFAVVCPQFEQDSKFSQGIVRKLMYALSQPFEIDGRELMLTVSVGISLAPEDGVEAATLLHNAELAMHRAKQQGRDTYEFYAAEMSNAVSRQLSLETELRRAVENEEFEVYYQPKFSPLLGKVQGMEALVRWRHPTRGMVSPAEFIPLAEETGLIASIGEQVLRQACVQTQQWREAGHELTVAVNLSARQFRLKYLIALLQDILAGSGLSPRGLELEITESAVMNDVEGAIGVLKHIRDLGLKVSMDDFGTGYSSLSYLKRFPINKLKVDQSFVRDMHRNPEDASIVDAVISLARSLKIHVVAEGVELPEHYALLAERGCDEIQGYLISRPLPAEAFSDFLAREIWVPGQKRG